MFHKEDPSYKRGEYTLFSLDDLVPKDHLLRQIEATIDFSFIYDKVENTYSHEIGRPSLDPVLLVKIPLIQTLFGIRSMRQTIKEIEVNVAYRWFLGLGLDEKVPHFTTYGKNYVRRFAQVGLMEDIFAHILQACLNQGFIDASDIFIDGTHVKAAANGHKYVNQEVASQAKFMSEQLDKEITQDRKKHEKKSLKLVKEKELKNKKQSKTDPESGWFHKGEHKEVFAYNIQAGCDKHGWVLGYTIQAGNIHDSQAFIGLFNKLAPFQPSHIIADSGYKTPSIAKFLIDQDIIPVFPYTRPRGQKDKLRPKDFVYDAYYDCYLCPENQILAYTTTNRTGYREYKSNPSICKNCPLLSVCTESKTHQRLITRHIWQDYMEQCEAIRQQRGMKERYQRRKESIERIFGSAKEYHNMRYTRERGKSKMEAKVGLTFACLNLKKLVKMMAGKAFLLCQNHYIFVIF